MLLSILGFSACGNTELVSGSEPKKTQNTYEVQTSESFPVQQFATLAFMSYRDKITNGYQNYCERRGYKIDSYLEEVKKIDQDLILKSEKYFTLHPDMGLQEFHTNNKERVFEAASEELSSISNPCEKLQRIELNMQLMSFRARQPDLLRPWAFPCARFPRSSRTGDKTKPIRR